MPSIIRHRSIYKPTNSFHRNAHLTLDPYLIILSMRHEVPFFEFLLLNINAKAVLVKETHSWDNMGVYTNF